MEDGGPTSAGSFTLSGIGQRRDAPQAAIVIFKDSPLFDAGKELREARDVRGGRVDVLRDRRPRVSPRVSSRRLRERR
jgi:hypothetical protein